MASTPEQRQLDERAAFSARFGLSRVHVLAAVAALVVAAVTGLRRPRSARRLEDDGAPRDPRLPGDGTRRTAGRRAARQGAGRGDPGHDRRGGLPARVRARRARPRARGRRRRRGRATSTASRAPPTSASRRSQSTARGPSSRSSSRAATARARGVGGSTPSSTLESHLRVGSASSTDSGSPISRSRRSRSTTSRVATSRPTAQRGRWSSATSTQLARARPRRPQACPSRT